MNWPEPGDRNGVYECIGWDYKRNQITVDCVDCSSIHSLALDRWMDGNCPIHSDSWIVLSGNAKSGFIVKCALCGHTRSMSGHQYKYLQPTCQCKKQTKVKEVKPLIEGKVGKGGIVGNWIYVSKDRDGFTWTCKACGRDSHTQTSDVASRPCMECYQDSLAMAEPTENDLALWASQPEIGEAIQASRAKRREQVSTRQSNVSGTN